MEAIAMPMQTTVAGAEITSMGTWNQPMPPSIHNGTSVRLTITAKAPRTVGNNPCNNKIVIASMTHCALNQGGFVGMEEHYPI